MYLPEMSIKTVPQMRHQIFPTGITLLLIQDTAGFVSDYEVAVNNGETAVHKSL